MCGLDSQRVLEDYRPPPDPFEDTRPVVVCHPQDEKLVRIAAEALDLNVHVAAHGPDPGQVYLFNPAQSPPERVGFDYLLRSLGEETPEDPWWDTKAQLREYARDLALQDNPRRAVIITGI